MSGVSLQTVRELQELLGEAHWAARDIAARLPGVNLAELMDRLHTARKMVEAMRSDVEPAF